MLDGVQVFYNGGPGPAWLDRNAWAIPVQFSPENADKIPVTYLIVEIMSLIVPC